MAPNSLLRVSLINKNTLAMAASQVLAAAAVPTTSTLSPMEITVDEIFPTSLN